MAALLEQQEALNKRTSERLASQSRAAAEPLEAWGAEGCGSASELSSPAGLARSPSYLTQSAVRGTPGSARADLLRRLGGSAAT